MYLTCASSMNRMSLRLAFADMTGRHKHYAILLFKEKQAVLFPFHLRVRTLYPNFSTLASAGDSCTETQAGSAVTII
jgi:hypothetical protein